MQGPVHFIGIGGSGMAPLAELCLLRGLQVSGSDLSQNNSVERLVQLGAAIYDSHAKENIADAATVVYSSAIGENNPERLKAAEMGLPLLHRSDLLQKLSEEHRTVVVSGTHGKTTTTAMIVHVLTAIGADPTAVVGGKMLGTFNSPCRLGKSDLFVFEADESDGSFLKYHPFISLVTNVEEDHLDFFHTVENLENAFASFVSQTSGEHSTTILGWDDRACRNLGHAYEGDKLGYGFLLGSDVRAINYRCHEGTAIFTAIVEHDQIPVHLPMIGKHNVKNALAALSVVRSLKLDVNQAAAALASFGGVSRRMNLVFSDSLVSVYDDYAHNPGKISACISSLRESWPDHSLIVVYQPHRYSRLETMFTATTGAFGGADTVYVLPVYTAGESTEQDFSPNRVAAAIAKTSRVNTVASKDFASVEAQVLNNLPRPAIILTVGAGDVWQISDRIGAAVNDQIPKN